MMEHDMREKARNAMRLILEAARFEVDEVDEPLDLSAVREGVCLLVLCTNEKEVIAQFDKTNYSLMVNDHEMTCKKLLFTLEKDLNTENCVEWGVDEFVRYAGEAVLADILDRELALDLSATRVKKAAVSAGGGAGGAQAPAPQESSGITIPHFPVKLNEQAAIRAAGIQGAAKLRFIPYFLFHYTSTGEQVYKDRRIRLMPTAGVRSTRSTASRSSLTENRSLKPRFPPVQKSLTRISQKRRPQNGS